MIPTVVASEALVALHDFLKTGFGPSNPELSGVVDDFLARPGQPGQGAVPVDRASLRACCGGRRTVPAHPAGVHAIQAPARGDGAAVAGRGALHGDRHGDGFRQDRVLPVPGAGALSSAGGQAGRQGGRRLPHERLGVGPGAAHRADRPRHAVAAGPGDGRAFHRTSRGIAPQPDGTGHRDHGSQGNARTPAGHPAHQLQDAGLPDDPAPRPAALAPQPARHAAVPGRGRAPHLRRRPGHGLGVPDPSPANAAGHAGGEAGVRWHVGDAGRRPSGVRVAHLRPGVRRGIDRRRSASNDRRLSGRRADPPPPVAHPGVGQGRGPSPLRHGGGIPSRTARALSRDAYRGGLQGRGVAGGAGRRAAAARRLRELAARAGRSSPAIARAGEAVAGQLARLQRQGSPRRAERVVRVDLGVPSAAGPERRRQRGAAALPARRRAPVGARAAAHGVQRGRQQRRRQLRRRQERLAIPPAPLRRPEGQRAVRAPAAGPMQGVPRHGVGHQASRDERRQTQGLVATREGRLEGHLRRVLRRRRRCGLPLPTGWGRRPSKCIGERGPRQSRALATVRDVRRLGERHRRPRRCRRPRRPQRPRRFQQAQRHLHLPRQRAGQGLQASGRDAAARFVERCQAQALQGLSVLQRSGRHGGLGRPGRQPARRCAQPDGVVAPQRRPQGDRVLRQRAGRRSPRRLRVGPNVERQHAGGDRPDRRRARRLVAEGAVRTGRRSLAQPLAERKRRRQLYTGLGPLRGRVHRSRPPMAQRLSQAGGNRPLAPELEAAGACGAANAVEHPRRVRPALRHRANAGEYADGRRGRGPRHAGQSLQDSNGSALRRARGHALCPRRNGPLAGARHRPAHEGPGRDPDRSDDPLLGQRRQPLRAAKRQRLARLRNGPLHGARLPRNQGHGQVGRGSAAWLRQQGQVLVSEVDAEGSGPRRPGPGSPRFRCRARDRAPGDGRRGTCAEGGDRQGTTRMGLGARPPLRRRGGCRGAMRRRPPAGRPPSGGKAVAGRAEPGLASPGRVRPSRSRSPHLVRAPLPRHAGPPHRRRRAHGPLAAQRTRTP